MMKLPALCFATALLIGLAYAAAPQPEAAVPQKEPSPKAAVLKNWKSTEFSGCAQVRADKDTIILEKGDDMTGVTWIGTYPKMNYEINLDAKRMDGDDFFCGLTFPVGEDPCSFIVGGWGGTCVGISSLDFNDAYNNETARMMDFDKDRWYHIRVRITPDRIEAWIDDKQMVDVKTEGRKIGIRSEVELSRPIGVATWRTTGAFKNFEIKELK